MCVFVAGGGGGGLYMLHCQLPDVRGGRHPKEKYLTCLTAVFSLPSSAMYLAVHCSMVGLS